MKYSFFASAFYFLSACAHSNSLAGVVITNNVKGCFTITKSVLDASNELAIVTASIGSRDESVDCPCKSALMKYSMYQKQEQGVSNLMVGYFTTMNKSSIVFPVAVQRQLIFPELPIQMSVSCSNE